MNKITDFVNIKEIEGEVFELMYVDMKNEDDGSFGPQTVTSKTQLSNKLKDEKEIISEIIEKVNDLSTQDKDEELLEKFSLKNIIIDEKDEGSYNRRVIAKILNASNYIASEGRIGAGNNLIISEKNYKKYSIKKIIPQLYNMNIILEDVDDIYIFRKNSVDQPGLIMIKNKEKYELVDIGFYPQKYFLKIKC